MKNEKNEPKKISKEELMKMPPLDTGGGFYIPLIAKENKVFFAQKEVYGLD